MVEITLNPFQGLKQLHGSILELRFRVEITLNPFQGLKPGNIRVTGTLSAPGRNHLESLSGIETRSWSLNANSYLRRNHLESLSGIETVWQAQKGRSPVGRNHLESLSGIETFRVKHEANWFCEVEITLNPFQGLKRKMGR